MKRVKHFFAPCMELLVWPELKSTFLFSLAAAQQSFRLFVTHLWWLFPVVLVMVLAQSQTMMPILSKFNFFDVIPGVSLPQVSVAMFIVSALISNFCSYFFSFAALLLMRPSREAKDWNYLVNGLNAYFIPSLVVFPAYLLLSGYGLFATAWAFSMLFFMDNEFDMESLSKSLKNGFWACARFFPVVIVVSGVSAICFAIVGLGLAFLANWMLSTTYGSLFVAQIVISLSALGLLLLAAPLVFFHLAVINTVYIKILSKFRGLFFKED